MAAEYAIRPGFDHVARLRANVGYERTGRRSMTRTIAVDSGDPFPYSSFLNYPQSCAVHEWLASDAAHGRWTYKFFINQMLVSFDDPDTAFAFRMRWC